MAKSLEEVRQSVTVQSPVVGDRDTKREKAKSCRKRGANIEKLDGRVSLNGSPSPYRRESRTQPAIEGQAAACECKSPERERN